MSRSDWSLEQYQLRTRQNAFRRFAEWLINGFAAIMLAIGFGLLLGIAYAVANYISARVYDNDASISRAAFSRVCKERLQAGLDVPDACRPIGDGKRGDLER